MRHPWLRGNVIGIRLRSLFGLANADTSGLSCPMQCEISKMGRHLYVDADTRQTCLEKPLIECHALYHQICQQIFVSQHGPPRPPDSRLAVRGFDVLSGAVNRSEAAALSCMVSNQIDEKDRVLTVVPVSGALEARLLAAMESTLDRGLSALLEAYYASHFRVVHCQLYRTEVDGERHYSFRWHRDVEPMAQIHVMIYLTPSGPDDGGTQFLDFAETARLAANGYAFGAFEDRVLSLGGVLPKGDSPPEPERPMVDAGDAVIFAAPRILHRGVAPKHGHRDVLVLNIMPSLVPWRATLEEFGTDHLFSADGGTRNTLMTDPFDPLMAYFAGNPGPVDMPPWAMFGGMLPA